MEYICIHTYINIRRGLHSAWFFSWGVGKVFGSREQGGREQGAGSREQGAAGSKGGGSREQGGREQGARGEGAKPRK